MSAGPALPDQSGPSRLHAGFEECYGRHIDLWYGFALVHTGDPASADGIVDEVTAQLYANWPHLVARDADSGRFSWGLLKTAVARWIRERGVTPAFVETSAFERVCRALGGPRDPFAVMEESIGLYTAIRELPERQYDVIVMRYVLGYSDEKTAAHTGISPLAVQSLIRQAKLRLSAKLGSADQPANGD